MKNNWIVLLVAITLVALPGYAQQSNGGNSPPPPGSSSTANDTSNASVVVNQNTETKPELITAVPGGIPGTFPGFAPDNPECQMYAPQGLPDTSAADDLMSRGEKLPRGVHAIPTDPDQETTYSGPVPFMRYNPEFFYNPGDKILATIEVPGKYHKTNEPLAGRIRRELRKAAPGMKRVSIVNCPEVEAVTKANTFGFGGTTSGTPNSGNVGGSVAAGFTHGTSRSTRQAHATFYAYAMNEGPLDPPKDPNPPDQSKSTPPQKPEPAQPITVRIEVVSVPSAPQTIPPVPTPAAVTPAPEQEQLPQANVYFDFDHPKVSEGLAVEPIVVTKEGPKDNTAAIHTIQQWLETHPSVKIDVIGYACYRGPNNYNWDLGGRRAKAVFKALIADEKIKNQVIEPDSNGKDSAATTGSEYENWWDRRVSFRIHGSDSSGR